MNDLKMAVFQVNDDLYIAKSYKGKEAALVIVATGREKMNLLQSGLSQEDVLFNDPKGMMFALPLLDGDFMCSWLKGKGSSSPDELLPSTPATHQLKLPSKFVETFECTVQETYEPKVDGMDDDAIVDYLEDRVEWLDCYGNDNKPFLSFAYKWVKKLDGKVSCFFFIEPISSEAVMFLRNNMMANELYKSHAKDISLDKFIPFVVPQDKHEMLSSLGELVGVELRYVG